MSSKAQRQVFVGLESPAGTVNASPDVCLRAVASLKAVVDKIAPNEDIGSFAPARHYIGSKKAEGSLEFDGYSDHAPIVVSMAMGAGSKTGVGDPYTWTFTLPDDSAPTFATYTMEYTDGNNHIVHAEDVFATDLEISGEAGKSWMFKPTVTGGNVTYPAALSATPSAPTAVKPMLMADTTLSIDDTWDNLGNTSVGVLISFNWKLENLQHSKLFAGALYPTSRGNDKWKTTLELIVEIDNATIESEKDKLLNTTQSAIGLTCADSNGYGGIIDGMYMLKEVDTLDDRDGNNIVKLTYQGEKDASDNTGRVIIVSTLANLTSAT